MCVRERKLDMEGRKTLTEGRAMAGERNIHSSLSTFSKGVFGKISCFSNG